MMNKKVIKNGSGVILVGSINSKYAPVKRGIDILASSAGILLASPVLLIAAIAIKLDSKGGPVFFRQKRTGLGGENFDLLKFRSMIPENDVRDRSCEDKYTRVGKVLRKTSIDELPQLFNVLRGEMSLIGPRPWIPEYYENMSEEQRHKYDVKPGITGLAQVKGRNALSVFERINYDLIYVNNYSFRQDLKVLALTAKAVLMPTDENEAATTKLAIHEDIDDLVWQNTMRASDTAVGATLIMNGGGEFVGEVEKK